MVDEQAGLLQPGRARFGIVACGIDTLGLALSGQLLWRRTQECRIELQILLLLLLLLLQVVLVTIPGEIAQIARDNNQQADDCAEKCLRDGIKKTPLGAVNLFGKLLTLAI